MITVGGEANSDLRDFWAFNIDLNRWFKSEIEFKGNSYFTPKRFHTVNAINETQVVSFGGCHSEYIHMNEMHIFDLTAFLADPFRLENRVVAQKIDITEGVPSTRWGHAAATHEGKLYIFGGRND